MLKATKTCHGLISGSWASEGDRGVQNGPMGHFLHMITLEWLYWSLCPLLPKWVPSLPCVVPTTTMLLPSAFKTSPPAQYSTENISHKKYHWCVPRWLIYAPITGDCTEWTPCAYLPMVCAAKKEVWGITELKSHRLATHFIRHWIETSGSDLVTLQMTQMSRVYAGE